MTYIAACTCMCERQSNISLIVLCLVFFVYNNYALTLCFILTGQVEAIKQAMAGFSLPPRSQPQWAHVVPEDVWKAELIGGLQQTHRHKPKSKTKQKKL